MTTFSSNHATGIDMILNECNELQNISFCIQIIHYTVAYIFIDKNVQNSRVFYFKKVRNHLVYEINIILEKDNSDIFLLLHGVHRVISTITIAFPMNSVIFGLKRIRIYSFLMTYFKFKFYVQKQLKKQLYHIL